MQQSDQIDLRRNDMDKLVRYIQQAFASGDRESARPNSCSQNTSQPYKRYPTGVVYGQGRSTIFRMLIYPMLNQWNANPMTPNPGL